VGIDVREHAIGRVLSTDRPSLPFRLPLPACIPHFAGKSLSRLGEQLPERKRPPGPDLPHALSNNQTEKRRIPCLDSRGRLVSELVVVDIWEMVETALARELFGIIDLHSATVSGEGQNVRDPHGARASRIYFAHS